MLAVAAGEIAPAGVAADGRLRVTIDPWPLSVSSLDLSVVGRMVPVAEYASAEALAARPGENRELPWRLESAL